MGDAALGTRLQLFGPPRLFVAGEPVAAASAGRLQSLLAFLALHADQPQPRERVASSLWPESDEGQARTNLRQLLHHLRKAAPSFAAIASAEGNALQWPAQHTSDVGDVRRGSTAGFGSAGYEKPRR